MTDYPNNILAKLEIIKASEIGPKEVKWLRTGDPRQYGSPAPDGDRAA